jgi:uncharacterized protein
MRKNNHRIHDLIDAIILDNNKAVLKMINQGISPSKALDGANVTPLHYAAQYNAIKCISLLIEKGASIHAKTFPDGQTPLEIALLNKSLKAVQLLMEYAKHVKEVPC